MKTKTRPTYRAPQLGVEILDCHLHGPTLDGVCWSWRPMFASYREYLDYLVCAGVTGGVQNCVDAVIARTAGRLELANTHALNLARSARRRGFAMLPAAIVHPRFLRRSRAELARFRRAGSCWAGELCPYLAGWDCGHANLLAMCRMIQDEGFILQIHHQPGEALWRIAEHCPSLPLVVSHLGNRAEMNDLLKVAADVKTVYIDLCGNGHERLGVLEYAVGIGLADRLLYGSDFPINEPGEPAIRILNSRLPAGVKRQILSENLRKLLANHGATL